MPNWCMNTLTLTHSDSDKLKSAIGAFEQGKFLEHFVPLPNNSWDYSFCVESWGTKWDVGDSGEAEMMDENTAVFNFDSAWSPPIAAYKMMCEQGFTLEAFYHEPGMAYVGKVVGEGEEFTDDYYEYSDEDSTTVREYIGEEPDDYWGISDSLSSWEEEDSYYDDDEEDEDNEPQQDSEITDEHSENAVK